MRKTCTLALIACFLVLSTGAGWASASGGKNPAGVNATSQEKAGFSPAVMNDFKKAYADRIIPLMDSLEAKFMELDAIQHLASTTKEDVTKVIKEITELKVKLRSEMKTLSAEMRSKGINPRAGHSYCMEEAHPGMMMSGCMHGMGGMMNGHGARGRSPMHDDNSSRGDGSQWMDSSGHNMPHMRGQMNMQGNAPANPNTKK